MGLPELPMPEEIDDDHACYNCDWFRFVEELPGDDDGIALGRCWAMPVKTQVKAAWSACHFWKRRKEDLH